MLKIKESALKLIFEGARRVFPLEFFAILYGKGIVEGIYIVRMEFDRNFVRFFTNSIPRGMDIIGTVHSHPVRTPPSREDLETFSKFGGYHLIVYPPFSSIRDVEAFDSQGRKVGICVVK